jgi:hypothetical protein
VLIRCLSFILVLPLVAQAPIVVDVPPPLLLDLRDADAARLVPKDDRDAAAMEAVRRAWRQRLAPFQDHAALRILLPRREGRLSLLLAAAQTLKALNPEQRLYLAHDPGAPALWEESAWGAVDGGALLAEELGSEPGRWRELLARAQEGFPGRPWFLWLPADPGPLTAALLGDGGRLVVPGKGPAARLAAQLPAGFTEVEGGLGDLTLRPPGRPADARRWRFEAGEWRPADLPRDRHEVAVTDRDRYDVGALLARMRATQLRDRSALQTFEAKAKVDLHIQGSQGLGADLGFRFQYFEKLGEGEELLQKEVLFNGVKANLRGEVQLPIIESRTSMAAPVALTLTERYRYQDGGPGAAARTRRIRFEPVGNEADLYRGELLVDEDSGRILEETSSRENLPGTVKSERRTLRYRSWGPAIWRVEEALTFERWVGASGVSQVQRRIRFEEAAANAPGFETRRGEARTSEATMLKRTPEGLRYFTRQADGSRRLEEKPRTAGRALGAFLFMDPNLNPPVLPVGGLVYFDFNAFDRGVQLNAMTAVVFNTVALAIPSAFAGVDVGFRSTALFLAGTERPVRQGRLLDKDGVGRRFVNLGVTFGRDLGAGFRTELEAGGHYDRFSLAREEKYRTPGFELPPSGLTRTLFAEASWQARGFQLRAYHGWGRRPEGSFGTAAEPQRIPEDGAFRRWGGSLGYDRQTGAGIWLHGEGGFASGRAFDRFNALDLGGLGGTVRIAGIRSGAIAADRLGYAKAGLVLPSGPGLRLSLTLDHAKIRSLDDQKDYRFTGLGVAGDLPGFWWFTTVRIDLGAGLHSDIPGLRTVNGWIALLKVF